MKELARLWFGRRPVGRGAYAASLAGLLALRFGIEAAYTAWRVGGAPSPWQALSPFLTTRVPAADGVFAPDVVAVSVALALPVLWAIASLSARRAHDAGYPPWIGALTLVPVLNALVMGMLAVAPAQHAAARHHDRAPIDSLLAALLSATAGAAAGLVMICFSVFAAGSYGAALFLCVPFVIGCVTGFAYNSRAPRSALATQGAVQLALALVGGGLLAFALEGALCIAMAYPLAAPLAAVGGVFGRAAALPPRPRLAPIAMALLAWPVVSGVEAERQHAPRREVVSHVEIDAPPAVVWPFVVGFETLPPPTERLFRLGIAYPRRARIEGHGVGAVRYCEFSTGAFVEPITHWEEPVRLAFDVRSQPPPMHEWSPYRHVHAPHLIDGLRSRRGEFRLVALPGGRTRLEGSTWYELELFPQAYWTLWSDALIHDIHARVLRHIGARAEAADGAR